MVDSFQFDITELRVESLWGGWGTGQRCDGAGDDDACLLHVARHMLHVTRHTSHVTRHTSHVTRHTSQMLERNSTLQLLDLSNNGIGE